MNFYRVKIFLILKNGMEDIQMKSLLGSNIQKRRRAVGISQAELDEKADISINFLSKLERNKSTRVSSDTLYLIAQALNTSMESLVNNMPAPEKQPTGPKQSELNELLNTYLLNEREMLSSHIIAILEKRH